MLAPGKRFSQPRWRERGAISQCSQVVRQGSDPHLQPRAARCAPLGLWSPGLQGARSVPSPPPGCGAADAAPFSFRRAFRGGSPVISGRPRCRERGAISQCSQVVRQGSDPHLQPREARCAPVGFWSPDLQARAPSPLPRRVVELRALRPSPSGERFGEDLPSSPASRDAGSVGRFRNVLRLLDRALTPTCSPAQPAARPWGSGAVISGCTLHPLSPAGLWSCGRCTLLLPASISGRICRHLRPPATAGTWSDFAMFSVC
jgi:hypothetical protein